jgi:hypothetical protein
MAEEIIKIDGDLFGDIQPSAAPKTDSGDDPMGLKILSGEEKGISINLDENLGSSGAIGSRGNDNNVGGPMPLKTLGEIDADATKKIESTSGAGDKPSGGGGGLFSNFSLSSGNETKKVTDEKPKSQKELDDEKNDLLAKLTALERRGVNLSRSYDMNSSLDDVRAEYGRIKATRELENSVKFQRKMLMASVTAIEFLNNRFDPFDVELEGWSETVHENVDEYDEVFEELYEKYRGRAQIAPEIKLMMMLGGSAFMFHLTKTMFKSSIPGMDEILKQNPEIARQVASAAAKTMSGAMGGSSGGGGSGGGGGGGGFNLGSMMGMMGNLMGGGGGGRRGPAPSNSGPSRQARAAPSRRPDMEGPGNVDDILRELDQSSVGTANQARGVSVGRGDGNTRVSVERSDANTLILNV